MNINSKSIAAGVALLIAGVAHALAGGFGVSVTMPKAGDPKDAVLVVEPIGCAGPGASVTAVAEGIENGVRKTIPLKLQPVSGRGDFYSLSRQWPAEGKWALVFTARKDEMRAVAIIKLDKGGNVNPVDRATVNWSKPTVLSDKKTTLRPWTFTEDTKVVVTHLVSGDLKAAIDYTLLH